MLICFINRICISLLEGFGRVQMMLEGDRDNYIFMLFYSSPKTKVGQALRSVRFLFVERRVGQCRN